MAMLQATNVFNTQVDVVQRTVSKNSRWICVHKFAAASHLTSPFTIPDSHFFDYLEPGAPHQTSKYHYSMVNIS